jgi:hypothetical protein
MERDAIDALDMLEDRSAPSKRGGWLPKAKGLVKDNIIHGAQRAKYSILL